MDLLASVKARVIQRYPEMEGVQPSGVEVTDRITVLTFHNEVKAEDGAVFPNTVRVVVDNETGVILNIDVSNK